MVLLRNKRIFLASCFEILNIFELDIKYFTLIFQTRRPYNDLKYFVNVIKSTLGSDVKEAVAPHR